MCCDCCKESFTGEHHAQSRRFCRLKQRYEVSFQMLEVMKFCGFVRKKMSRRLVVGVDLVRHIAPL